MRDLRVAASAMLSCLSAFALTQVQDDDARYRETYAIVDAKIEVGDGRVIEKGTVLVRDGRIAAVGAGVNVPGYARIIKGAGLTVYPGFIDAFSVKGVKLPDWNPDQDQRPDYGVNAAISMRVANRKGVRPDLNAADYLDLGGSLLYDERKAGFSTALIAPSGGILNGSATLINLDGRPPREAILVPTFGSAVGFSAPGQGYPGTPLGVMAYLRQTFYDAQRARAVSASGDLPRADRPLEALQPVLRGETPVLIDADRSYEITRAFTIADQFNLKPILVGGGEAFMQADEIKRRGISVILGIHFQAEPKPDKKEEPRKPGQKSTEPAKDEPKKDDPQKEDPVDTPPEVRGIL